MTLCVNQSLKESEILLKDTQVEALQKLDQWDEELPYKMQSKKALLLSNEQFIHYREKECYFFQTLGGGAIGHALNLRRKGCEYNLNIERVQKLKNKLDQLPMINKK